jgi:predicted nucleic acid-binding protein
MIMIKIAIDTNILIYSHDAQNFKHCNIANTLIKLSPIVSAQVVSEYINVLKRTIPLSKEEVINLCIKNLLECTIHALNTETLIRAAHLIRRYNFQIFDSIIVASALEAGCDALYSEDMQHCMKVDGHLKIINPFL